MIIFISGMSGKYVNNLYQLAQINRYQLQVFVVLYQQMFIFIKLTQRKLILIKVSHLFVMITNRSIFIFNYHFLLLLLLFSFFSYSTAYFFL